MNDESASVENQVEVLPPADPRALVRIQKPDVVDIIRRAAAKKAKKRGRPSKVVVETATNVVKKTTRKQYKESDKQAQAFEYYLELGNDRTLGKVAEHFNLSPDAVDGWSHRLAWTNRIRAIENRDVGQIIEDTGLQIILSRLKGMFIPDPIDMKKLILDPTASVGALKDLVTSFINLDKNSRERKEEDPGDGAGTGKGKNQFMVNVIIEK